MDDMTERMSSLEKDMLVLKTDVAVMRSNYATKADVAQLEVTILKWFTGSVLTLAGVIIAAAKFIH